jgi:hypothetical protein
MSQGRLRGGLAAILAVFCLLGVAYSVSVPLFEAPDEIWHFSFVNFLATEHRLPIQPTEYKDVWLRESGQPPVYHALAAMLAVPLDTSDFPAFVRFNELHPAISPGSPSTAANLFIHTPHEAFPYSHAVLAAHLARLLSVAFGAGTVAGAFLVAREVLPSRPGVALASAAVAAFNPQFVFISSVVNNDSAAAFLCTIALWLAIRSTRLGFTRNRLIALGVVVGIALLSKVSALALLGPAGLALLLAWLRDRSWRALLAGGAAVAGLAALVAGWWYARNWVLYGDPLGWRVWMMDIVHHRLGLPALLAQFRTLGTSFWLPYDDLFPPVVLTTLGALAVLAAVGWVRMILRRTERADIYPEGMVLAGAWFGILFASVVFYMVTTPADQGRLLFPGIASSSLLLVLGWRAALPSKWWRPAVGLISAGLAVLCAAAPLCAIAPRFAAPLVRSHADLPELVPFTENPHIANVHLLGVDADRQLANPGDTVLITAYWEAAQPSPSADVRFVVQLWTEEGRLINQLDVVPAGEAYPPDLWQAGDIVWQVFPIALWGDDGPVECRVRVDVVVDGEYAGIARTPTFITLR